jgi:acetyl-CoA carboxylase biotin carboxyl carrier protein
MDLTHSDVQSILKIIDAAEHLQEIEIVHGGFRLHVVRNGGGSLRGQSLSVAQPASLPEPAAPPAQATPAPAATKPAETIVPEGVVAIRAPMVGVFYRASAPGEKPFVEVGQRVRADDTVCLIEVMKLFNSIRAGVDGEVVKILAENGALVEFDQPVIFVKPGKKKG